MQNKTTPSLVIILLVIIAAALVYLAFAKPKTSIVAPLSETVSSYENTPESKMKFWSESVYIESFEKRSDDYWYISFLPFDALNPGSHENRDGYPRIFKASPDLKIVTGYPTCENPTMENFGEYVSKLSRQGDYWWNPSNNDPTHFKGFYIGVVQDGLLTGLEEVEYNCGA